LAILVLGSAATRAELGDGLGVAYGSPAAPVLELQGLDGKHYRLVSYRGRVVVVNYWATWCLPCIEEMPAIQRMWEQLNPAGLEVLAVNAGEREETIERFLDELEPALRFPILIDKTGETFEAWDVKGLPVTFVVGKEGRIIYSAEGGRQMDSDHILERLRHLINK
jgi:peroxiredoxin